MLKWKENSLISTLYDDIYFSVENGIKESRHVFIQGNQLEKKFSQNRQFSILELGFGTGLNFLTALLAWKKFSKEHSFLHFFSFEKNPLIAEDIYQALSPFSEIEKEKNLFLKKYVLIHSGFNQILFEKERVFLNLIIGDVQDYLENFEGKFDVIFLDGFSPPKNPSMWTKEVCDFLAKHSKTSTSLSSFSVAKKVRENLSQAGFYVWKEKGFGKKREMLKGKLKIQHQYQNLIYPKTQTKIPSNITIIGGGISGCALAYILSKRKIPVTLIEKESSLAHQSPNLTISLPYITKGLTPASLYSIRAFAFCRKILQELDFEDWKEVGALKFFQDETEEMKISKGIEKIKLKEDWIQKMKTPSVHEISGLHLQKPAFFFPKAFFLHLKSLCRHLLSASNINLILNQKINSIDRQENEWNLYNEFKQLIHKSEVVIFANSTGCNQLFPNHFLNSVRGQMVYLKQNEISQRLKTILYFQNYFTPSLDSLHTLGSTYNEFSKQKEALSSDNLKLLQALEKFYSFELSTKNIQQSQVGFRSQTKDRTPAVGHVPDINFYFDLLQSSSTRKSLPPPTYLENLYLSVGLGSRGVIYSFLNAILLSSLIFNEPLPLEFSLYKDLHPLRFLTKNKDYSLP